MVVLIPSYPVLLLRNCGLSREEGHQIDQSTGQIVSFIKRRDALGVSLERVCVFGGHLFFLFSRISGVFVLSEFHLRISGDQTFGCLLCQVGASEQGSTHWAIVGSKGPKARVTPWLQIALWADYSWATPKLMGCNSRVD